MFQHDLLGNPSHTSEGFGTKLLPQKNEFLLRPGIMVIARSLRASNPAGKWLAGWTETVGT